MKRIAVFASGSGSNFQSIVDSVHRGELDAEVKLLVCDKPQAMVLKKAEKENIPSFSFDPKAYENKAAFELNILQQLEENEIDLIVLAGYMRLIGPTLLKAYQNRIINLHPSLLPSFPGKAAMEQALEARVKVTGITIHYVDEGMDTGPIIAQEPVRADEGETINSLAAKIHAVEHKLYPKVIQGLVKSSKG